VASASLAAQPDVGAEAIYEPVVVAAGVRTPQMHDIAEPELDDAPVSGWHGTRPFRGSRRLPS
jgi:hypothetical protein